MAQKGFNLMVFDFKNEIINVLNNSILPISIKRQVFDEIVTQIKIAEEKTIQDEQLKYQEDLKAEEDLKEKEEEDVNEHK